MSKLNNKLSNLDQKMAFVAKGDFFSVLTKFYFSHNTIIPRKSYLTRISRFNQEDFQNFIKRKLSDYDVTLLSSDIFYDKYPYNNIDYIDKQSDFSNLKLIPKLFDDITTIDLVVLDFNQIKIIEYKNNKSKIKLISQINQISINDSAVKINNFLFDPFIGDLSEDNLKIVKKAINTLTGDMIILVGEYIWTGKFNWVIQNILNDYNFNNKFVVIDYFGIYEALLKGDIFSSNLKFLNKDFFIIDYFFLKEGSFNLKKYIDSNIILEKPSNYDKYGIKVYVNNKSKYICLKQKNLSIKKIILYKDTEDIHQYSFDQKVIHLLREDFILDIHHKKNKKKDNVKIFFNKRIGVKLFDYLEEDILDKITIDVIARQKVQKGERLAKYKQAISLLEKRFFAPISGKVNLDYIKFGYIFIESEKRVISRFKNLCNFIIRPQIIIGEQFMGLLNENIIYVSFLDKELFDKYIQIGISGFIARSISKDFFFDIERFNLDKFATIAIIDGINIKVQDDKHILNQIPSSNVAVDFLLDKNYLKFYTNLNYFELSYNRKMEIKKGDKIKVIHNKYWGENAMLISSSNKGNILKIKHPFLSKIEKINLL